MNETGTMTGGIAIKTGSLEMSPREIIRSGLEWNRVDDLLVIVIRD